MKIGIDARLFIHEGYTGIGRSTYEILRVWLNDYPEHDYYLFSHLPLKLDFDLPSNWHTVVKPFVVNKGALWESIVLPRLVKDYKLDKFWGTNFTLPKKIKGTDYYVTIYDLAALKFEGIGTRKIKTRLGKYAPKACQKSKKVIAISEATKQDVVSMFGVEANKIIVSYCGGMPTNYQKRTPQKEKINLSLIFDEPFFLFIGTIEPRKNIKTIIKAYEAYIRETGGNERLVLAGRKGWNCDDIYALASQSEFSDRIIMPGFISDDDKSYLLSNAEIFLFPSLYEGFGIPVLEAFEYDLPVITSNVSSLPEVGGEAAYYIENVENYDALKEQIMKLKMRPKETIKDNSEKMREQIAKFSWKKNADEMMAIICG